MLALHRPMEPTPSHLFETTSILQGTLFVFLVSNSLGLRWDVKFKSTNQLIKLEQIGVS